jgi:hypothetical protein
MNAVQTALNSPRFHRYLLWFGVAVLAAGALTLTVTLVHGSDKTSAKPDPGFHPTLPEKSTPLKNSQGIFVKTYSQLDPDVRKAVKTFIGTAVARQHVESSWPVVAPEMRAGYTLARWKAAKDLPVIPYPGVDTKHVQYYLDYASTKEILVEVGLAGKPGVSTRPVTFQLGLVPVGSRTSYRWLVNYWMPRWTPPVPTGN